MSFHNLDCEGGILLDMESFISFSPEKAKLNYQKTRHACYLNIKRTRIPKKVDASVDSNKPKVLGIGVEGGFKTEDQEWEHVYSYSIVLLPQFETVEYPNDKLPPQVQAAVKAIIEADSAEKKEEIQAWVDTEEVLDTKIELVQLKAHKSIGNDNTSWSCDVCHGDATTNLWLNLTDGFIGCGRENFDGSGGKGHALQHYKDTGYPLAVKLGTITPDGNADVFSYAEDNMVRDPQLTKHLLHWGLDVSKLTKTDKTVAELEIELQHTFDWSRVQERNKKLVPVYGPGFTGIENLGNTCYMASVLQVLFKIPDFVDRYYTHSPQLLEKVNFNEITRDFHAQFAKIATGLLSGEYSKPPSEEEKKSNTVTPTVRPFMFKSLIGEGHHEFSTNRQQDSLEFFQFLLQTIERKELAKGDQINPSSIFEFKLEERLACGSSGHVRYSSSKNNVLSLIIPLEKATNLAEVEAYNKRQEGKSEAEKKKEVADETAEDPVWPRVTLASCLSTFTDSELITDWISPVTRQKNYSY